MYNTVHNRAQYARYIHYFSLFLPCPAVTWLNLLWPAWPLGHCLQFYSEGKKKRRKEERREDRGEKGTDNMTALSNCTQATLSSFSPMARIYKNGISIELSDRHTSLIHNVKKWEKIEIDIMRWIDWFISEHDQLCSVNCTVTTALQCYLIE